MSQDLTSNTVFPDKIKRVLFVCTGNSCRSVIAEWLFKKMSKELGKKIKCESAGIGAFSGMGPTEEALKVLKTEGIDARAHKSQRVTRELVKNSDIIFVMQRMHESFIIESCPDAKDKVFLLGEFVKEANERVLREGIADPIGMGLSSYEETKLIIKNALGVIFEKLKG